MNSNTIQSETGTQAVSPLAIWGALLAVYIIWGSTYLAIRFAIESMPPFLMAGSRFLIAGGLLYAWRRARGDSAPTRLEWRSAAIAGILMLTGGTGGVVWAEQRVISGVAALLIGTTPLWMTLMDALSGSKRKADRRAIAGVVIGFGGVVVLIGPAQFAGGAQGVDPLGAVVLILAAALWASGSLYSRQAIIPPSPLLGTSMQMLVGGAALLGVGLVSGDLGRLALSEIAIPSLLGWLYLIVVGSWGGFVAYTWLLRVAPTPLVSTYAYVNPVVAILLGYLLAAEPLTPRVLLAATIIVGSVALTTSNGLAKLRLPRWLRKKRLESA
ncbi:MAG: EamA family transporter [Thermoflexales bacterium]|nr:EamA family transporter [Thermoflexales bacterium]